MALQKKTKKRLIIGVLLLLLLVAGTTTALFVRNQLTQPFQLSETAYIYIDEQKDFEKIVNQLNQLGMPSEKIFRQLSERMKYIPQIKTGRYAIKDGMNTIDVVRILRAGQQDPVRLTFNNIRLRENLAGRLSSQLMLDSTALLNRLNDQSLIDSLGFNADNFSVMFIPNTYEVWWDTSVESLIHRMKREYNTFWNENRLTKANALNLSPVEVSILASIVEEEATYADEYSTVAGLYLNRLQRGMRLEADPTVKYAVGDFSLRRILFRHLEVESPYNTYKVEGLPPGPIRIPSISAIDAVLSPRDHNYLFMCAKDDLSGRHNFAVTHAEHARNARRYQQALNNLKIYK